MASKTYDAGYGNKIHGLVGTFCESTSVDAVAQAMNRILRCVDGQPISNYIPLGQQKNTLVSSKGSCLCWEVESKGIHPVLFGRVLDAVKRARGHFFGVRDQAFFKIVRRGKELVIEPAQECDGTDQGVRAITLTHRRRWVRVLL